MEFTDAYLEKGMTGFHEYASAASRSVRNVRSSQTLHDVAKSDSRAAGVTGNPIRAYTDPGGSDLLAKSIRRINFTSGSDPSLDQFY